MAARGCACLGLSRRRSRVRVPSLPLKTSCRSASFVVRSGAVDRRFFDRSRVHPAPSSGRRTDGIKALQIAMFCGRTWAQSPRSSRGDPATESHSGASRADYEWPEASCGSGRCGVAAQLRRRMSASAEKPGSAVRIMSICQGRRRDRPKEREKRVVRCLIATRGSERYFAHSEARDPCCKTRRLGSVHD